MKEFMAKKRGGTTKSHLGANDSPGLISGYDQEEYISSPVPVVVKPEVRKPVTAVDIMTGKVTRASISRETYQKDEWTDPI